MFMLVSGGIGNITTFPLPIKALSYIAPQRYACTGFMHILLEEADPETKAYILK